MLAPEYIESLNSVIWDVEIHIRFRDTRVVRAGKSDTWWPAAAVCGTCE